MKINFSSIGDNFSISFDFKDMSGEQKCRLFKSLMDDMGITEGLLAADQKYAFKIIDAKFEAARAK